MASPHPRARRPVTRGAAPVPPRVGGNRHKLRRARYLAVFGALLLITLIMIAISYAF